MITHYDLFAGIGGFSLALDEVFYDEPIRHIFCEWDGFATQVLRKHWPDGEVLVQRMKERRERTKVAVKEGRVKPGSGRSMHLVMKVATLPTPSHRDWKGGNPNGRDTLDNIVEMGAPKGQTGTKTGLKLQPSFVAWMMGYPDGWTEFDTVEPSGEKSRSSATATP